MTTYAEIITILLWLTSITCEQPSSAAHLLNPAFIESPLVTNWIPIPRSASQTFRYSQRHFPEPPYAFIGEPSILLQSAHNTEKKIAGSISTSSQPQEHIQVLYVPLNSVRRQTKYPNFTPPSPRAINDFYFSSTLAPLTTTIAQRTLKPKPHQPPLALFMRSNYQTNDPLSQLLQKLSSTNNVDVLDNLSIKQPEVFVGPSGLKTPLEYLKFNLPYLSNIERNRLNKKNNDIPFYVAPLSYTEPQGYFKIAFPAPHVGGIIVRSLYFEQEPPSESVTESTKFIPISHAAYISNLAQNNFSLLDSQTKSNFDKENPLLNYDGKIQFKNTRFRSDLQNNNRKLRVNLNPVSTPTHMFEHFDSNIEQTTPQTRQSNNSNLDLSLDITSKLSQQPDHIPVPPSNYNNRNQNQKTSLPSEDELLQSTHNTVLINKDNINNANSQTKLYVNKQAYETVYSSQTLDPLRNQAGQTTTVSIIESELNEGNKHIQNKTDFNNAYNLSPIKNEASFIKTTQQLFDASTNIPEGLQNEKQQAETKHDVEKKQHHYSSFSFQNFPTIRNEYSIIDHYNDQYNKAYEILSKAALPSQTSTNSPKSNTEIDQLSKSESYDSHQTRWNHQQVKTPIEKAIKASRQRGTQTFRDTIKQDYPDAVDEAFIDIAKNVKSLNNYSNIKPKTPSESTAILSKNDVSYKHASLDTAIKYTLPPKLPQISETLPGLINSLQDATKFPNVIVTSPPTTTTAFNTKKVSRGRRPVTVRQRESTRRQTVQRRPIYQIRSTTVPTMNKISRVRGDNYYNSNNKQTREPVESQRKNQSHHRNRARIHTSFTRYDANAENTANYPQKKPLSITPSVNADQIINETEPLYENPNKRVIESRDEIVQISKANAQKSNEQSLAAIHLQTPTTIEEQLSLLRHEDANDTSSEKVVSDLLNYEIASTSLPYSDKTKESVSHLEYGKIKNSETTTIISHHLRQYTGRLHDKVITSTETPKIFRIRGKMRKPTASTIEKLKNDSNSNDENHQYKANKTSDKYTQSNNFFINLTPDDQSNYESIRHVHVMKLETSSKNVPVNLDNTYVKSNKTNILLNEPKVSNIFIKEKNELVEHNFETLLVDSNDFTTSSTITTKRPAIRRGYWRRVQKKNSQEDTLEASESHNVQSTYMNRLQNPHDIKKFNVYDFEDFSKATTTENLFNSVFAKSTVLSTIHDTTTEELKTDLSTLTTEHVVEGTSTIDPSILEHDYGIGNEQADTSTDIVNGIINAPENQQTTLSSALDDLSNVNSLNIVTSTAITHETEICYRGRCIKNPTP